VYSLQFLDAEKKVIVDIKGKEEGNWTKFKLEEGEEIIGFHAKHTNFKMTAIGIITIKKK